MDFQKDLKTVFVVDPSSSSGGGGGGWPDTPCHQKLGLVPKGCSLHSGWLISCNNHQDKTYELTPINEYIFKYRLKPIFSISLSSIYLEPYYLDSKISQS